MRCMVLGGKSTRTRAPVLALVNTSLAQRATHLLRRGSPPQQRGRRTDSIMLSRLGSSSGTHALRRTAGLAPLQLARTLKSGAWVDKELGYDTCAAALSCC